MSSKVSINGPEDLIQESYTFGHGLTETERSNGPLRLFLFGYPIATSLAPTLHSSILRGLSLSWTYELLETKDESAFLPALKAKDVIGCAVTMPFKVTMMSMVDDLSESSRVIGAINTVFIRKNPADGSKKYIGTNTDTLGVREAFLRNYPQILQHGKGRPALVIGGGGACRAAVYCLLKWLGASKVFVANRLESEVTPIIESFERHDFHDRVVYVSSVEQAVELESVFLAVGTVPDYPPTTSAEWLVRDIAKEFLARPDKGYALEMCYFPKTRTAFYEMGEANGWTMINGTEAMIWQGVAQESLWTEVPLEEMPVEEAKAAVSARMLRNT